MTYTYMHRNGVDVSKERMDGGPLCGEGRRETWAKDMILWAKGHDYGRRDITRM